LNQTTVESNAIWASARALVLRPDPGGLSRANAIDFPNLLQLLKRAESWPAEDQEELALHAEAIESRYAGG
jgi:hypothetical protein